MIHARTKWYREEENWRLHIHYGVRREDKDKKR